MPFSPPGDIPNPGIEPPSPESSTEPLGKILEKEMVTHSIILAWETPRREEPGGLQSMGLQKVGH